MSEVYPLEFRLSNKVFGRQWYILRVSREGREGSEDPQRLSLASFASFARLIWRRLSNRAITLQRGLFHTPNPVSLAA